MIDVAKYKLKRPGHPNFEDYTTAVFDLTSIVFVSRYHLNNSNVNDLILW